MAASASGGASLPHRAVSSIRGGAAPSGDSSSSANPRTPVRSMPSIPSQFNSPSSLRAEDEVLVIELGSRRLRAGFAGDAVPKALVSFSPAQTRRVGDLRAWEVGFVDDWARGTKWGEEHELWRHDVRGLDLGLVGDRMERGLREAFNKYLLIDSRPRRMVVVLPSGVPLPLLATALDTLFNRFHAPAISLLSSPVACAISAGVRSALVVDMGWSETVVTGVYEFREVHSSRSVRAGKLLVDNTHKLLATALGKAPRPDEDGAEGKAEHFVSFEECEEIVNRLVWCRHSRGQSSRSQPPQEGLPTVTEQDESESTSPPASGSPPSTSIWLKSTSPPKKLDMTYDQLATPSEDTFFASEQPQQAFDDEELPIPLLIYHSLLKLPMDVRALCMARIIFTGGCSSVLGLRGRVFDEVSSLIERHGWDPVRGKGVEAYKSNPKLRRGSKQAGDGGPTGAEGTGDTGGGGGHEVDGMWVDAPKQEREPELDPIDDQLRKGRHQEKPGLQGQLRAVESLGAWSGASLLNLLKLPALATVERETWREQGIMGASRPTEVDHKVAQRQSMGAGGLMRNTNANWTLGVWGYL
ncbi:hypothetical protein KVR01_009759 [Diaporthe batatas]|uniref:uncharacterized protein n=1 Tax=Diaporthe batatas TaxID=748121 RepID=UPI001D057052|nr:uncharacterized protein KVR01_009759 [Diaporthe batatas]KAG8160223.1 hypothetical protein KVR01_009759 [Diaporthe batatas]